MATATLNLMFSASLSKMENLSFVRAEVWKLFEAERSRIYPREMLVINDGIVFHITDEASYDHWSKEAKRYVSERIAKGKVVTVTTFVE